MYVCRDVLVTSGIPVIIEHSSDGRSTNCSETEKYQAATNISGRFCAPPYSLRSFYNEKTKLFTSIQFFLMTFDKFKKFKNYLYAIKHGDVSTHFSNQSSFTPGWGGLSYL